MERKSLAAGSASKRLFVVLVATRNPLNIDVAARAMSNFGFKHLRVVNPYKVAFREAKSAVGASTLLKNAEEYKSVCRSCSRLFAGRGDHGRTKAKA
jgi:tRNA/rRNA methyltransferase